MKARVTSISWHTVTDRLRPVTVEMENALAKSFEGLSFGSGIDQLTIVIISTSFGDSENQRISKGYNRIRKVRNPFTQETIKTIGLAIPLDLNVVEGMIDTELSTLIRESVLRRIANPDLKIPKDFNYEEFSKRASVAIFDLFARGN